MELERQYNQNNPVQRLQANREVVSNEDESLRLFESDALEKLTKVHPATPLVIFVPVIGYLIFRGISVFGTTVPMAVALFFYGLGFWTFFEYALHRFVFHFESQTNSFFKKLHFLFHGIHHAYPRDSRRLVMPPSVSIPLALLVYWGCNRVLPEATVPNFLAGFLFGYLCYDMIHYLIHHGNFSNPIFQAIKKHHYRHHYANKEQGFGVSSALWDYIFRS